MGGFLRVRGVMWTPPPRVFLGKSAQAFDKKGVGGKFPLARARQECGSVCKERGCKKRTGARSGNDSEGAKGYCLEVAMLSLVVLASVRKRLKGKGMEGILAFRFGNSVRKVLNRKGLTVVEGITLRRAAGDGGGAVRGSVENNIDYYNMDVNGDCGTVRTGWGRELSS